MYELAAKDASTDYSYYYTSQLVDEYLPPSECFLENFQLTSSSPDSSTSLSSSSEMNSTCSSLASYSRSYSSPIAYREHAKTPSFPYSSPVAYRAPNEPFFMPVYSDYFNSSSSSSIDYQPAFKFNMVESEPHHYDPSFTSTSESTAESSLGDCSPNDEESNGVVQDKCEQSGNKEQIESDDEDDEHDKPNESVNDLIINAILSTSNLAMQTGEIYKYLVKNYTYYARMEAKGVRTWKNSVRYNLTRNFVKTNVRSHRGHFWTVEPNCLKRIMAKREQTNA